MCIFVVNKMLMMKYYSKEDEQRILANPDHFYQCLDLDIDIVLEKNIIKDGISQKISIKGHTNYSYQDYDHRNLPLIGIGLRNMKREMLRCLNEAVGLNSSNEAPNSNNESNNSNQPLKPLAE